MSSIVSPDSWAITITLDRYGHLMPGNEEQAAGLLDAYLASAEA
jgi:hypothetical protein